MEQKSSNKKVLWNILFIVVTIVLCYLSIVVYFFYISPYNIALKLALWPFTSTQTTGEMYQEAIVQIEFIEQDEYTFEDIKKTVVGVNVRQDGYVLAPLHLINTKSADTDYRILTNEGTVYQGNLLYCEKNFNLAVFKCENLTGQESKIKIPYVKISSLSTSYFDSIVATSSTNLSTGIFEGEIVETDLQDCKQVEFDSKIGVLYVIQDCFSIKLNNSGFLGGAIFNDYGKFYGFSFEGQDIDGSYIVMPVDCAKLFLDKVVTEYHKQTSYKNELSEALIGFDKIELSYYVSTSNKNENDENKQYFYFEDAWQTYTDDIKKYYQQMEITGFYLFEDFELQEQKILSKDSIITSVQVNQKSYKIQSKIDLFELCYTLNKGDEVKFLYYENINSSVSQKSFIV